MFEEQIKSLTQREEGLVAKLEGIESEKKRAKAELAVIRKAKKQMEGLEQQLASGQDIEEENEQPVVSQ